MNLIDKIKYWEKIKKELEDELDNRFDDICLVSEIPDDAIGSEEEGYWMDMSGIPEDMSILYVIDDTIKEVK